MASTGPDIEELVKRISSNPGVRGFLILNHEGIAIRHSFTEASRELSVQYAALFQSLAMKAKNVLQEIGGNNELQIIRLRSKKDEVIVAPDNKYMLIIIQEPIPGKWGTTAALARWGGGGLYCIRAFLHLAIATGYLSLVSVLYSSSILGVTLIWNGRLKFSFDELHEMSWSVLHGIKVEVVGILVYQCACGAGMHDVHICVLLL